MASIFEWTSLVLRTLASLSSTLVLVAYLVVGYRLLRIWIDTRNPAMHRNMPQGKYLVRRIFCKHRHVSRLKDPYGRIFTACTSCGQDVNAGKDKEEWR